jgi:hypothetical protein
VGLHGRLLSAHRSLLAAYGNAVARPWFGASGDSTAQAAALAEEGDEK